MTRHDPALAAVSELRANVSVPFEQAKAMPKSVYTSPEFAAMEETHIFAKEWLCAGRAEALAAVMARSMSSGSCPSQSNTSQPDAANRAF